MGEIRPDAADSEVGYSLARSPYEGRAAWTTVSRPASHLHHRDGGNIRVRPRTGIHHRAFVAEDVGALLAHPACRQATGIRRAGRPPRAGASAAAAQGLFLAGILCYLVTFIA